MTSYRATAVKKRNSQVKNKTKSKRLSLDIVFLKLPTAPDKKFLINFTRDRTQCANEKKKKTYKNLRPVFRTNSSIRDTRRQDTPMCVTFQLQLKLTAIKINWTENLTFR